MNNFLSINRLSLLIKKDCYLNSGTIWIALALITGLLLLGNLISPRNIFVVNYAPTAFYWILFIGGIWVSSSAFKEAHSKIKSYAFFTLPSSTFEKFFSKLLLTALIFPIAALLVYSLFYWIIAGIALLINGMLPPLFNPLQTYIFRTIWAYLVFQSIFFLGSIYFRNKVIIKTLLVMVIFSISISIVTAILGTLFARSLFIGNIFYLPDLSVFTSQAARSFGNMVHLAILIVLPLFCWLIAYIRLGETEV